MASVKGIFSGTWVDGLGDETAVMVPVTLDDTKTIANLSTDWQQWAGLADGLSDGFLIKSRVEIQPNLPVTTKTGPAATSRIETRPLFTFNNTNNYKAFGLTVPAIAQAIISGGKIILTSGSAADLFIKLITGVTATIATTYDNNFYQLLTSLKSTRIVTRKARRQLDRTSYEV